MCLMTHAKEATARSFLKRYVSLCGTTCANVAITIDDTVTNMTHAQLQELDDIVTSAGKQLSVV